MSRSTDRTPQTMTSKTSPLSRAVHCAVLGAALATPTALLLGAAPAWAQSQAEARFDIPAGPLDSALTRFAARAGVTVSFDPAHARGLQSPGLQGTYSVEAGLRQLLAGSRLQAVRQGNGSYSLLPAADAGVMQLESTSITGAAAESAWGPPNRPGGRWTGTLPAAVPPPPRPTRRSWRFPRRSTWSPPNRCRTRVPAT